MAHFLIRAADLDRDGDLDLVHFGSLADGRDGMVEVLNQGHPRHPVPGTGQAVGLDQNWSGSVRPVLHDLEGDGLAEMLYVAPFPGHDVRVVRRTRDGEAVRWGAGLPPGPGANVAGLGFSTPVSLTVLGNSSAAHPDLLLAGVAQDLPGLADPDVHLHAFLWQENQGYARSRVASFHELGITLDAGSTPVVLDIRLADLDGDGDRDALLLASLDVGGESKWGLWRLDNEAAPEDPLPVFTHAQFAEEGGSLPDLFRAQSFDIADVDGDGAPDMLVGLQLHRGRRVGVALGWPGPPEEFLGTTTGPSPDLLSVDATGDGLPDLLVVENDLQDDSTQRAFLRPNLGTRGAWIMGAPQRLPGADGYDYSRAAAADLDGDGAVDFFRVDSGAMPAWARHTGATDPSWHPWESTPPEWNLPADLWAGFAFGDVDADGDPDLVYASGETGLPALCLNTGDVTHLRLAPPLADWGGFSTRFPSDRFSQPRFARAAGDTRPSLVFGRRHLPDSSLHIQQLALDPAHPDSPAWSEDGELFATPDSGMDRFLPMDFEGDGDLDLFLTVGFESSLRRLVNTSPTLPLRADRVTVETGESLDLAALAAPAAVLSRFVENASGATLEGTVYRAGLHSGLDVLELSSTGGPRAILYINVLPAGTASTTSQAILIAGGKSIDDPVWPATHRIATRAHDVLRHQGFAPDSIDYLSFGFGLAGGASAANGVDAPATLEELDLAFARAAARGAGHLYVCLVDHGSASTTNAFLRLSDSELLSASRLKARIDAHQALTGGKVTVILDFCYAGAFLPHLDDPAHTNRLVIASCGPDQLAYFIARGLVSFSDLFMNAVLAGSDVKTAYRIARAAMLDYQTGQMDADADGLPDPEEALPFDNRLSLSPDPSVGRDIPQIAEINPNLEIDGQESALVWASGITGPYPIAGVWAVVIPSDGLPVGGGASSDPVIDLPEVPLPFNPLTGRYEATLRGLGKPGLTKVVIFARDVWDSVSFPRQAVIRQTGFREKAVILFTGASDQGAAATASQAYRTLKGRLLDDADLRLLGDVPLDADGDGTNDVHAAATVAELTAALGAWAVDADRLSVVLTGHATGDQLVLDVPLDPSVLAAALDQQRGAVTGRPQVVLLEYAGAGAGVAALAATNRVVFAAAPAGRGAVDQAGVSFTGFFLSEIAVGRTVGESARSARVAVRRYSGNLRQKVLADDDADGIPNEKSEDFALADTLHLGAAFLTGDDLPHLGEVTPSNAHHPAGAPLRLHAAHVTDADCIDSVWCDLALPDAPPGAAPLRIPLAFVPANGRWEAAPTNLVQSGVYALAFTARDTLGNLSAIRQSEVIVPSPGQPERGAPTEPDAYEAQGDNDPLRATVAELPFNQFHTLHSPDDTDWFIFQATSNHVIDVETRHISTNLDTRLTLYRLLPDGGTEELDSVDEYGTEMGELAGLTFPADGLYLIKVSSARDPALFTPGEYQIGIYAPAGAGALGLLVSVLDTDLRSLLPGTTVRVTSLGTTGVDLSHVFSDLPYYVFRVDAGDYLVTATPPGGLEVSGYQSISHTTGPEAVPSNPYSYAGNPRVIRVSGFQSLLIPGTSVNEKLYAANFSFESFATLTGSVESVLAPAGVSNALIRVEQTGGILHDRHPWTSFGTVWQTGAGGIFPDRVRVSAGKAATVSVLAEGYAPATMSVPAAALARGTVVPLVVPPLVPLDRNTNTIADLWELEHFGAWVDAGDDPDHDHLDNRAEFIAGTDPSSPSSRHQLAAPPSSVPGALCWRPAPGRGYQVWSNDEASAVGWRLRATLPPLAHPPAHQVWTDDDPLPAARFYRLDTFLPDR